MLDITDGSSNHTSEISSLVNENPCPKPNGCCPKPSCQNTNQCPDRYLCRPTFDLCSGDSYCVRGCNYRTVYNGIIGGPKPCPAGETCYYKPGDGDYRYSHKHISSDEVFIKILKKPLLVQK